MSEEQPMTAHEGAQDDEVHAGAKSAEDRKAASALASLDTAGNEEAANNKQVDREAVTKAMKSLGGSKSASASKAAPSNKNIKVDDADVALLVDQLELPKGKATELLRAHDGDAVGAMKAWVRA
ncbi:hypothetical protein E4U21_007140 [Claviceps maximensis]|nr:hypothetical protein E4U21_007140 [Claviceps maximensis]